MVSSHHYVINSKKPGKLRIVFDCAAEVKGVLLNNSLIQRPDLTNLLVGVLTRFRKGPVALVADIRSMFHQVKVNNEDKNALKFLWWKEFDFTRQPDVFQMTVYLFGSKSSLSCASFALKYTAELFKNQYSANAVKAVLTRQPRVRPVRRKPSLLIYRVHAPRRAESAS